MMPSRSTPTTRRGERSASPLSLPSEDSSTSSGASRAFRGILARIRGFRRRVKHEKKEGSQLLDVLQNMRLRGRSDKNNVRSAMSVATAGTIASTQASCQMNPYVPNQTARRPTSLSRMRSQTHSPSSIYNSISHESSSWNRKSPPEQRRNSRSPRRDVPKRIRSESSANLNASPLYTAISTGKPRHVIEKMLVDYDRDLSLVNNIGMKVLHCAIERYDTEIDVLRLLLASNLEAAAIRCANGNNSVNLLWKRFVNPEEYRHENQKMKASRLREIIQVVCDPKFVLHRKSRGEHALLENTELTEFWELLCEFIYVACHGELPHDISVQQKQENLLFGCIELDCCPLLIQFAAALHPEQLRKANKYDQLPLHVAAMTSPRALEMVVELYPKAAFSSDFSGRFPLHLALANNITWGNGMQSLICAAPFKLMTVDPITGLTPVLQAAASETGDLTTIYNLLSANPAALII